MIKTESSECRQQTKNTHTQDGNQQQHQQRNEQRNIH
jgi:hypothetical protein